jgi:hypothetical protein
LFDQLSLCLDSETKEKGINGTYRARLAPTLGTKVRRTRLRDHCFRNQARPRSLISQLPAHDGSRPDHVPIERIQFAGAPGPIPNIDAPSISLDPIIFLLDGRECFKRNNPMLYLRAEEPLTIHPTPKGVGFLGFFL